MQTVNETSALNSKTGSGLKSTDFLGLKRLFRFLGGKKNQPKEPTIEETLDGFWVVNHNGYGLTYTGPYKREQDAKGVRTRMLQKLD
jgi:hypothetical protein